MTGGSSRTRATITQKKTFLTSQKPERGKERGMVRAERELGEKSIKGENAHDGKH